MREGLAVRQCECGCKTTLEPDKRGRFYRFAAGHQRRVPEKWTAEDRGFETKCWIWGRAITSGGYGVMRHPKGGQVLAHRVLYERFCEVIPEGVEVHHLCGQKPCVNPEHLVLVSRSEHVITHSANGERRSTKLTVQDVTQIKASAEAGVVLAKRFGVTPTHITYIRKGKSWAWL